MGDFLNVQQKRIDKNGFGQVAGELTTEALFWALPVSPALKVIKGAKGFFSPGVKATKASKAYTPGKDFLKYEGKTQDVSISDQLGFFFNKRGKSTKSKQVPFVSSSVTLGKGFTKGKKKGGNNFFGGSGGKSSGVKSKGNDFFSKEIKGSGSNQFLLTKTKSIPKTKIKPKTIQFEQFLKLNSKYEKKVIAKELAKLKVKPKQKQFFKQLSKPKQKQVLKTKQVTKQNFFKPIPILKVNQKQQQKQKQFFKEPTKQTLKITPKLTPKQKDKQKHTALVAPFFPPTTKTGGGFFPLPYFNSGGRRGQRRTRKRPGQKAYTAWNVNTKQVGGFLKGPTYKKSKSDYIFKDLDKRTSKAKKEKDYDYLDFF
jgi:hypothetical protein